MKLPPTPPSQTIYFILHINKGSLIKEENRKNPTPSSFPHRLLPFSYSNLLFQKSRIPFPVLHSNPSNLQGSEYKSEYWC